MTRRIDWVDIAKGICIIMVVMMHSTLGVGEALGTEGFMHAVVAFAKPFRMPDFFLISGLFLAAVIDRDWRRYGDRKVVHFAYFYVLWTAIQLAVKAPGLIGAEGLDGFAWRAVSTLWAPFGTMWFLYMLPVFFVVTKLLRRWPVVLVGGSVALYFAHPYVEAAIDPVREQAFMLGEFSARYVYFVVGYLAASHVFALMRLVDAHRMAALGGLALWALVNTAAVRAGISEIPLVGLPLGLAGAMAIATIATLLTGLAVAAPVRYAGEHSIVVYLSFFLPMALTRTVLIKAGVADAGIVSLVVTVVAVVTPLLFYMAIGRLGVGGFLFRRPAWAHIDRRPERSAGAVLQPAE